MLHHPCSMPKYFSYIIALCFSIVNLAQAYGQLSGYAIAKKHAIVSHKPAPGFFDGALLGNGGMGVNVTTRPDAIVLYFGHNNVWDIRLAENHKDELGTFEQVFDKVKNIPATYSNLSDDAWYSRYSNMAGENYRQPYPRPFPCGSVLLGFDRRKVQVLGHVLDIANGLCTVKLLAANKKQLSLLIFTDMVADRLFMQLVDNQGKPAANVFDRVKLMPDPSTPHNIPQPLRQEDLAAGLLSFRQILPSEEPAKRKTDAAHPQDKAFRLAVKINGALSKTNLINWNGVSENMAVLEAALPPAVPFYASVALQEGLATAVSEKMPAISKPEISQFKSALAYNEVVWKRYWARSAVSLDDAFLEEIWYRNLYFFNCAAKAGVTCPGLFANWSYNNIGTAWHGDYHMN
jgi:alpha-L-fucosidase 2